MKPMPKMPFAGPLDAPATAGRPHSLQRVCGRAAARLSTWRTLAAAALLLGGVPWAMAQDALLARNLAATCANCHGTNGHAVGDMKPIAGMPADKLIAMLDDYRNGNQPATIMHQIVKGYTEEQIRLIAGYMAAQKPARP